MPVKETSFARQEFPAYGLQGTPSLILIDRLGRLRRQSFGAEADLRIGADIAFLLAEPALKSIPSPTH